MNTSQLFFLPFLALSFCTQILFAQTSGNHSWTESNNWQYTVQKTLGTDIASSWLTEQVSNGATVLESTRQQAFILVMAGEFVDMEEAKGELEVAVIEGQVHLIPDSDVRPMGHHGYSVICSGNINGKTVQGQRISLTSITGESVSLLVIGTQLDRSPELAQEIEGLAYQLMNDTNTQERLAWK